MRFGAMFMAIARSSRLWGSVANLLLTSERYSALDIFGDDNVQRAPFRPVDGSQTNREAIVSCDMISRLQQHPHKCLKPIRIRQSRYLNNRIEQDHSRIKRRVGPMLGFKAFTSAAVTLAGIEMVQMMRKRQGRYSYNPSPSLAEQFDILAVAF